MPHYLFHLADGDDVFIDDTGKELEDCLAAHAHALRIIEKVRLFIPDAHKNTGKVRITMATGQSVMTVLSRGVEEIPPRPFGKRPATAAYNEPQETESNGF
jgi:hypothetical protein